MLGILAARVRDLARDLPRLILASASVFVATALVVGVVTLAHSFTTSVARTSEIFSSIADVEVRGVSAGGISEAIIDDISATSGVEGVVPIMRGRATLDGEDIFVIGIDERAAALEGRFPEATIERFEPADTSLPVVAVGPGVAMPSRGRLIGVKSGPRVSDVQVGGRVSGSALDHINGGRFLVSDIDTIARVLGRHPAFDSALALSTESARGIASTLDRVLAGRATVQSADQLIQQAQTAARPVIGGGLLLVALVSAVSSLVIYNTAVISVLQRRRELATVRALGARRYAVVGAVVVEFALLGAGAAVVGSVFGIWLAGQLIEGFPSYIVDAFDVSIIRAVPTYAIPLGIGVGSLCSVAGALGPARRTLNIEPAAALAEREAGIEVGDRTHGYRRAGLAGVIVIGVALVGARIDAWVEATALAVVGVTFLVGGLTPWITRTASAIVGRFGRAGEIAAAGIRLPNRRSATVLLVVVVAVVGVAAQEQVRRNFVSSIEDGLSPLREADVYVTTTGAGELTTQRTIPPDAVEAIEGIKGVAQTAPRATTFISRGDRLVLLEGVSPRARLPSLDAVDATLRERLHRGEVALVSERLPHGLVTDSHVSLPTPRGVHNLSIGAHMESYLWEGGVITLSLAQLEHFFGTGISDVQVFLGPNADANTVERQISDVLDGADVQADILSGDEMLAQASRSLDQATSLFDVIELLTVFAAGVALANATTISVIQRRQQFAVIRAAGAPRRVVGRIVMIEAVVLAVLGAAIGVTASALVHALELRALRDLTNLPLSYEVSLTVFALALVAAPIIAAAASVFGAWAASRVRAVTALRSE